MSHYHKCGVCDELLRCASPDATCLGFGTTEITAVCTQCLDAAKREADRVLETMLARVLADHEKGIGPIESLEALRKEKMQQRAGRNPSQN